MKLVRDYLSDHHTPKRLLNKSLIALVMRSAAKYCIIPMQDYLGLDDSARMNHPSTLGGNWQWRLTPDQLDEKMLAEITATCIRYGRSALSEKTATEEPALPEVAE
jgi:4-alpha-glucanotransferase